MAQISNEWHLRDPEAVASVLDTDIYRGLEPSQVSRRRRREGKNKIWHITHTSATDYTLKSLGDLTAVVLVIAALTSAIFERSMISVAVCAILALGIAFRVCAYVKARRILETMADEGIPSASVIRGGVASVVRADELVPGDVVMLSAGDIVPCDGRIVYGDEIRVSEQGITENKTSVIKGDTVILTDTVGSEIPCEYRVNMLFAGSVILAGECRIVATACGDDALVSMRRGGLLIPSGDNIPVINELSEWCRRASALMLVGVLALSGLSVALHLLRGSDFSFAETFIDAMALAASSVSSYLVSAGYITLTIPLRRIAERKNGRTVVKDASTTEKIASVKCVIATDISVFKSGTASYTSYYADGALCDVKRADKKAGEILSEVLKTVVKGDTKTSLSPGNDTVSENVELLEKITSAARETDMLEITSYSSNGEIPLDYKVVNIGSSETHNVIIRRRNEYEIHLSGGVREVLSFCSRQRVNGREVRLSDVDKENILSAAASVEARGGTVIAKAHRQSIYTTLKRLSVLQSNMCFDGFIVIEEALGDGVAGLAEQLSASAVSVVLLSSSTDLHRGYLAKAGILDESTPIITCRDVLENKPLPKGNFIVAVPPRSVTGGKIDAAGKVRIATARRLTETIDGAALITSEPSESGMMTEGAVGAAISNSSHRPIPQTLKRRAEISVYPLTEAAGYGGFAETLRAISAAICSLENLRRVALYTIESQFARIMCMLLAVFTGIPVVNAANILLLGMIFDFAAVLVISFSGERCSVSDGDVSRRRIPRTKDVLRCFILGALAGALVFAATVITSSITSASQVPLVSAVTIALLLVQLVMLSEVLLGGGMLHRSGKANISYLLYAVLSLAGVLAFMFSQKVCAFFGSSCPNWIVSTAAAASAVVFFAVYEAVKILKSHLASSVTDDDESLH